MGRPDGKNLQILDLHRLASLLMVCVLKPKTGGGGGGGTPLYGLYRYVRPQRVGFFSRFGHK